jgi:4'-phosphopantetheinyl transferase
VTSAVVRVFSVDLDHPAIAPDRLDEILAPEERDASPAIRVARASTRLALGEALGVDPATVQISRRCEHCDHPTHGRPVVVGDRPISFSLSHSASLALVAVLDGDARVGVDVEAVRPRPRLDALAARVLGEEEHNRWLRLESDDARLRAFLRAWTAKEAHLKALGIGITTPLRDVPARADGWLARELSVPEGYVAALAVGRTDVTIEQLVLVPAVTTNGGTAR